MVYKAERILGDCQRPTLDGYCANHLSQEGAQLTHVKCSPSLTLLHFIPFPHQITWIDALQAGSLHSTWRAVCK